MSEVTKKDLQSLQGYCNKQIADLDKQMRALINASQDNVIAELNKVIALQNKNSEALNKKDDWFHTTAQQERERLEQVVKVVNGHAKLIARLEAEV